MRRASAPGKLVIAGEYAVLHGHTAVVTAVDRRAIATVNAGDGPRKGLFGAALEATGARAALSLDTDALYIASHKLGLGSSAAGAVALCAALSGVNKQLFDVATRAHRAFTGGGSGIDLCAAVYGGTRSFVVGEPSVPTPLCPDDVELVAVFVGHSQSTSEFLAAVESVDAHAELADIAAAANAMRTGDNFFAAVDAHRAAMSALGYAAGIDIVSAPHVDVAAAARAVGGAAKPSGAGGGDIALAFVPRGARNDFVARLAPPLAAVDLEFGAVGARMEDQTG